MTEKINVAKILDHVPTGTKLYDEEYGEVELCYVNKESFAPIVCKSEKRGITVYYREDGSLGDNHCRLFPSENKNWEEAIEIENETIKSFPTPSQLPADRFREITNRMADIYERKNHDYGNSFDESLDEFGLVAAVVRISDKFNRLKSLYNKEAKVVDESIADTLMDTANYCIMTRMWMDQQNRKEE